MYCKYCGTQMEAFARFCPSCGMQAPNTDIGMSGGGHQTPYPNAGLMPMSSTSPILLLVLSSCLGNVISLALGIIALIFTSKVNLSYQRGDYALAMQQRKDVKTLLTVGWVLHLVIALLAVLLFTVVMIGSMGQWYYY